MVRRIGQGKRELGRTFFREWREYRGLSQDQLAARLDTNKSAVSKMERGAVQYNQTSLEAWAHALGCSPTDLISRDPNQQPDLPIFDLPVGDKERVFEFIRALRVTRVGNDDSPTPEPPDTPKKPALRVVTRRKPA